VPKRSLIDDKNEETSGVEHQHATDKNPQHVPREETATAPHRKRESSRAQSERIVPSLDDFPAHDDEEPALEQNSEDTATKVGPTLDESGATLEREIRRQRLLQNKLHIPLE